MQVSFLAHIVVYLAPSASKQFRVVLRLLMLFLCLPGCCSLMHRYWCKPCNSVTAVY